MRSAVKVMNISEKVAYIKGLAEGLSLDEKTAEGKVLAAIIDVLGDVASAIAGLKEDTEYLDAYVEELDEDLGALEEECYDCCCDDDCCCDEDDDCCCCDDDFVEVECPECGETVCLDDTIDLEKITCPACGAEFSCICDCCDEDDDCCCCGEDD